jgi:hypothetical protein
MKSKIEVKLNEILSNEYNVRYEPTVFYGKEYKLTVDFELTHKLTGQVIHFEYSGMNFFRKYYKILDVAKNNQNFYVIFDDENLNQQLDIMTNSTNLSKLTLEKTMNRIQTFYDKCRELSEMS